MLKNAGTALRVLRAGRRVSQMEVAATLGISHNRYWKIENGYAEATEAEREALAQFFGVKPRALQLQGAA